MRLLGGGFSFECTKDISLITRRYALVKCISLYRCDFPHDWVKYMYKPFQKEIKIKASVTERGSEEYNNLMVQLLMIKWVETIDIDKIKLSYGDIMAIKSFNVFIDETLL